MNAARRSFQIRAGLFHLFLFGLSATGASNPAAPRYIVAFSADRESELTERGAAIYSRDGEILIAGVDESALTLIGESDFGPIVRVRDEGQWIYLFHHREDTPAPAAAGATILPLNATTDLYLFPGTRRQSCRTRSPGGHSGRYPESRLHPKHPTQWTSGPPLPQL